MAPFLWRPYWTKLTAISGLSASAWTGVCLFPCVEMVDALLVLASTSWAVLTLDRTVDFTPRPPLTLMSIPHLCSSCHSTSSTTLSAVCVCARVWKTCV